MSESHYFVYIVRCADDTLYTGIATDLKKRIREHNGEGGVGAKYTRTRMPVALLYQEELPNRALALSREYAIKQLTRTQKLALVKSRPGV
jgi:putative endonuclease